MHTSLPTVGPQLVLFIQSFGALCFSSYFFAWCLDKFRIMYDTISRHLKHVILTICGYEFPEIWFPTHKLISFKFYFAFLIKLSSSLAPVFYVKIHPVYAKSIISPSFCEDFNAKHLHLLCCALSTTA